MPRAEFPGPQPMPASSSVLEHVGGIWPIGLARTRASALQAGQALAGVAELVQLYAKTIHERQV
jgi:hypothetical protein